VTLKRFRVAASVLIIFNVIGTVVTWTEHLVKPGTSHAHAIFAGTEFTGPLLFIGLWIVFVLLTLAQGKPRIIGVALMAVFAAVFTSGEISELFKRNVGISTGKWHFVLGACVVGIPIALATLICGIGYLVTSRKGPRVERALEHNAQPG